MAILTGQSLPDLWGADIELYFALVSAYDKLQDEQKVAIETWRNRKKYS